MKLRTWRLSRDLPAKDVAAHLGMNASRYSACERRGKIPTAEQLATIYLLTGGEVTPNDFYDMASWDAPEQDSAVRGAAPDGPADPHSAT